MRPITKSPTNISSSYINMQFQRPSVLNRQYEGQIALPIYNQSPLANVKTASPVIDRDTKNEF